MLTLSQNLHVGAASVFRDFVMTGNGPSFTNIFYVVPDFARWAMNDQGEPAFDLTWYKNSSPLDATKGAGIVTMVIDLSLTPDERSTLLQKVAAQYNLEVGAIQLMAVPFKSGAVQLTVAGESKSGDFVNQVAGGGPAQLNSSEQASFCIDITPDGAALLWQALEKHLDVFHVAYDLVFDHRLMSARMRVWCDVKKSHPMAAQWLQSGGTDPAQLRTNLMEQHLAGIELQSEQPLAPAESAALQKCGQDVLNHALASTMFGGPPAPGTAKGPPSLVPYSDAMEASLNMTLTESFPLEQHLVIDSVMHVDLTQEQFARKARIVEASSSGFFELLDVQIVCTVDFKMNLIASVVVHMEYDATGPSGRVHRTGDFVFDKNSPSVQRFRTDIASRDQTGFNYSADVYYYGDPNPLHLDFPTASGTVVVLNLDNLGVLRVRAELRDVPFEMVGSVVVDLRYSPRGATSRLVLDGQTMSGEWNAVVREKANSLDYKVAWVLRDGRRVEGEWVSTSPRTLYLDIPPELKIKAQVQVVAAGDFSDLAQILVNLRDPRNPDKRIEFAFTKAGDMQLWETNRGSNTTFDYEYKRTLVYRDGVTRNIDADWTPESRPVLVVRDEFRFEVRLLCRLLDLGGTLKMVVVELGPEEPFGGVQDHKTILVRNKNDTPVWSFRLNTVGHHGYRYRLSEVTMQGERRAPSEWQHSEDELLVLRPQHS